MGHLLSGHTNSVNCPKCLSRYLRYPKTCKCGGLIHQEYVGSYSVDFEDWSFSEFMEVRTVCDSCGTTSLGTLTLMERDVPCCKEGLPVNVRIDTGRDRVEESYW